MTTPIPTDIKYLQKPRVLEITFDNGEHFSLPCAYLRQHSPSAEKSSMAVNPSVNIISIEPVGQYAIKLFFDDGHHTGIYSWEYLYQLARQFSLVQ